MRVVEGTKRQIKITHIEPLRRFSEFGSQLQIARIWSTNEEAHIPMVRMRGLEAFAARITQWTWSIFDNLHRNVSYRIDQSQQRRVTSGVSGHTPTMSLLLWKECISKVLRWRWWAEFFSGWLRPSLPASRCWITVSWASNRAAAATVDAIFLQPVKPLPRCGAARRWKLWSSWQYAVDPNLPLRG